MAWQRGTHVASVGTAVSLCTRGGGCREIVLRSVNVAVLGALLTIGAAERPATLGIQDYGGGVTTLGLCPPSPNCIATSEELNDREHFAPPL